MRNFKSFFVILALGICSTALADSDHPYRQCWKDGLKSEACMNVLRMIGEGLDAMFDPNLFKSTDRTPDTVPDQFMKKYFPDVQNPWAQTKPGEWPRDDERFASNARMISGNIEKASVSATQNDLDAPKPATTTGAAIAR